MISNRVITELDVQGRYVADKHIRKESRPVIKDALASMRAQMRSLGMYDSGITEKSFSHKFSNNGGFLESISILAKRNAFVLAHAGQDYRWQMVGGRRELFNMNNQDDFIFPWIDQATEQIADIVSEHRADAVVKATKSLTRNE